MIKGNADALKAKAATADGSFPSSWMDAWSAEASADDTKQDANADNALNKTDGAADALDIKEKGEADAEQTKADGDAQTIHDKLVGDAQTAHDHAIGDANNITSAVAKDAYFATLPEAYAAFDWGSVANPAVLDAGYDELYAVDDVAMPLAAGQDDGASPLPAGDVIGSPTSSPQSPASSPPSSAPALGQSFSLAGTVDPYGSISGMTTFTGPSLLWDNGAYAPANPNLGYAGWAGAPWLNVGQTLPTSGGGGSPTMPPPQTPGGGGGSGSGSGGGQAPKAPPVPPTNPETARRTGNELSENELARGPDPAKREAFFEKYNALQEELRLKAQAGDDGVVRVLHRLSDLVGKDLGKMREVLTEDELAALDDELAKSRQREAEAAADRRSREYTINPIYSSPAEAHAARAAEVDRALVRAGAGAAERALAFVVMPGGIGEAMLHAMAPFAGASPLPTGKGVPWNFRNTIDARRQPERNRQKGTSATTRNAGRPDVSAAGGLHCA